MTTIAYKAGIMACDSAWTNSKGCVATLLTKIVRLSSGALVGEAGDNDCRAIYPLIDKIKCYDKLPLARDFAAIQVDYTSLLVFPNGELVEIDINHDKEKGWNANIWKVNRGFAAVGSGGELALGFMGAGRSAAEAVNFACSWDPDSKLPVHAVHLRTVKKIAQKRR